jgi:adenylate kinase
MRILLMGPPGVGKGTQAVALAAARAIPAISTGDLFRAHVRDRTVLGVQIAPLIAAGDYVPDAIVDGIVRERIAEPECRHGFVLDGYPRTRAQAGSLDGALAAAGVALDVAILLTASGAEIAGRLRRRAIEQGRSDDTALVIERRLEVYRQQTADLLEHYRDRGLLREVSSEGTVEDVARRIGDVVSAVTEENEESA